MKSPNHWSMLIITGVCLAGCATSPEKEHQVITEIISDPPGARIEVNGNYIGDAPVTTKIRHHPSDKVVMGSVTIRALPRGEGQYVQVKTFQGPLYPFDPHRDVVPGRVFFDMKLKPAEGAVEGTAQPK